MEQWKIINGFEGYEVSNQGNVRNVMTNRILKNRDHKCGYLQVVLYKDRKQKVKYVHRLVAEAFVPNPEGKEQVNHIDGVKTNNNIENLEWTTCSENIKHGFDIGVKRADIEHLNKIRDNNIKVIREKYSKPVQQYGLQGNLIATFSSVREAERATGICHSAISRTCKGKYKQTGGFVWRYI